MKIDTDTRKLNDKNDKTMDAGVYAELLVLWCGISQKAHKNLTNTRMPVRYELENGDIINELEFDCGSVYFYIDGEDDPYEWDNFNHETNVTLMTQTLDMIDMISHINGLSKRV
jgi:hypothetical protein